MGWERKRGKLEEFNRLLRGATRHELHGRGRRPRRLRRRALLHHARFRHAPAARRRQEADRHRRPPAEPAALRPPRRPRHRGLRDPAAAGERDHGERRRVALRAALRRPHGRRPLHDRRLRHLPGPLRRGDLHGQGALRRRRVRRRPRGAGARERPALARPVRGPVRAHGAGHGRRGRRRLPRERPRPRASRSTAGCAATGRSCGGCSRSSPRAAACGATICRSSRAGRSSTISAAACWPPPRWRSCSSAGWCCRASRWSGRRRSWPRSPSASIPCC